jgi:hypothetical protein
MRAPYPVVIETTAVSRSAVKVRARVDPPEGLDQLRAEARAILVTSGPPPGERWFWELCNRARWNLRRRRQWQRRTGRL